MIAILFQASVGDIFTTIQEGIATEAGWLFYSVAEPMFHFVSYPLTEAGPADAAKSAMDLTFLHWGFHPWAVYTMVGLALAFFAFNKRPPAT